MRVLIACEFSGVVRDAFASRGHDAWSCDLLSSERPGNHIQGDVMEVIKEGWYLMIAHPPCTYLCNSGVRWLKDNPERQQKRLWAIEFVKRLWNCDIPKVAIENPIGCLSTEFRKADQIIQPYQFGHPEHKSTCLWLRNLPLLKATNIVEAQDKRDKLGRVSSRIHRLSPGPDRWKERSRTYEGIAKAMAEQWG